MASTLAPRKPRSTNVLSAASRSAALVWAWRCARLRRALVEPAATFGSVSRYSSVYGEHPSLPGSQSRGARARATMDHQGGAARGHGVRQPRDVDPQPGRLAVDHRAPPGGHLAADGPVRPDAR